MALQPASCGSTRNTPGNATNGGNAANERNSAGRGGIHDDLCDNMGKSTGRRRAPLQQQPQRLHARRTVVGRDVSKNHWPLTAGGRGGEEDDSGEGVDEGGRGLSGEKEKQERDEMALAEARKKLLDPPQVLPLDISCISKSGVRSHDALGNDGGIVK